MARAPLRRKKGNKKERISVFFYALRWLAALFGVFYLSWSVFSPATSGELGLLLHDALMEALGGAAYLVPPAALYGLAWYFRAGRSAGLLTLSLGAALCAAAVSALLGLFSQALQRPETAWGGALGELLAAASARALGYPGAFLVWSAAVLFGAQVLFEISWSRLLGGAARLLAEDYRNWAKSRRELKEMLTEGAERRKQAPAAAGIVPAPAAARASAAPPAPAAALPPIVSAEEKPKPAPKPRKAEEPAAPGQYRLPSLDLLHSKKPGAPSGRPSDEEIREAVASLEATLASFEIQARVSGISPGPVITRYEVSPAPGVTVSSIVARSNDIALALRAKGLRMIAPIPGKAAIGIEIPNQHPAMVTLREVLESPALSGHKAPLAFALGLSSEGTPLAADLQAMPHVLVAGATNSGKSVMVHSMIASILFRRRPDEVKFLFIDPKRIELTLYDGIPHLYDPKTPAKEVAVITNPKKAAAALKALLRVMEDRYEKFQAYRVRDIAEFNREAEKRGDPKEFFIVVVIDELADLMVVARDVVEDSIQRLTQMARAVGIHLVLATQRPSVDVITGVIKANLPTRIALRVASKVDSKVILDGNGAESLLGKGDTLYLAPGQDPARIQGCFVSTQEIGALVDHLKAQGVPDYPTPDALGPMGEADLSQFGVEPLEFTQALKLVLERRRVSQDLLKSQFGSSARATNLLSLLEVKAFIHKPEGSNRWEIHFDKIEDYLQKNFPQVKLDKPGI